MSFLLPAASSRRCDLTRERDVPSDMRAADHKLPSFGLMRMAFARWEAVDPRALRGCVQRWTRGRWDTPQARLADFLGVSARHFQRWHPLGPNGPVDTVGPISPKGEPEPTQYLCLRCAVALEMGHASSVSVRSAGRNT